ncbi:retrovirus-related pol polyprotein from transposon TNT 1-94 [Tanacetum coccineum]
MATVSKSISIPNEEFSDDTTPSVARKFLNEVKSTIVTLQRVFKHKMTLEIHNWSSTAQREIYKILKDEIFPIINQVDARLQNFEIQFLKEAAKFVRDFKSLANEADESLDKQKTLEREIDRLLRAVVSQEIMSIVQNNFVVYTSNLQTELDRTKEHFENCIIQKDTEHAKLWNEWHKECEECKYDKTSYDKAYNDMHQKIERLQAQLGDIKGKCKDTPGVSDTLDPLSQKLENENVELEFQVVNYVSKQKDTVKVTSNSLPAPQESKVVKDVKVIAPGMFRINPYKTSREDKFVPINKVRVSVRTNPTTISQPHVITKKEVNSDSNGLSFTRVNNTAKTRRPQPRSNIKNDRVTYVSKSSYSKNKEIEVEEHHRNLLFSKKMKHTSSECNNVKLAIRNDKSKVVCAMCKQCLITANHDACVLNYVNDMNSCGKKQNAKAWKPNNVGSKEKLTLPKPRKPSTYLRWSPTGRIFDLTRKIIESSNVESHSDCSNGDNACSPNPQEPKRKRFPNSTLFLAGHSNLFMVRRLGMFKAHDRKSEASHKFYLEVLRNYLEVAFRRNSCFIRNLEGVDLLKGNHTTNLYTINLHEMASATICSWLVIILSWSSKIQIHKNIFVPHLSKKNQRASHPPKPIPNYKKKVTSSHMDLCGPMRIASYNWKSVIIVRTENGTEFKNQVFQQYFNSVGISHQTSSVRTPQQNGVVERRNRMLVEAARIMLIFSRAPIKLDISFLHVFGALCYPKNDREDIGKLGAKGDIGFFIGYSADSCAYRVYNRRTKKIMETMNVTFDKLSAMAFEQSSSKPGLQTIYDDYIGGQPSAAPRTIPDAQVPQVLQTPTTSTTIADSTLTPTNSSSQAPNNPNSS